LKARTENQLLAEGHRFHKKLFSVLGLALEQQTVDMKKKFGSQSIFDMYTARMHQAYEQRQFNLKEDEHMWHYMYTLSYESYVFDSGFKRGYDMPGLEAPTESDNATA
jgi:hypothetical protein